MRKGSFFCLIGVIVFMIGGVSYFEIQEQVYLDQQYQEITIDRVFVNAKVNAVIEADYLGYLVIGDERRLIQYGSTKDVLDRHVVGLLENSVALDAPVGNVILSGHNVEAVFRILHSLNVGDKIQLVTNTICETYQVFDRVIVLETDFAYLDVVETEKILTLITCCDDKEKRLLIRASKIPNFV